MSFRKRFFASKPHHRNKRPRREGWVPNPIHFHCGPGNSIDEEKSSNVVDENCRRHDIAYGEMEKHSSKDPKFYSSPADRQFIRDQLDTGTISGAVYALPFMLKNAVAPEWSATDGNNQMVLHNAFTPMLNGPSPSFGKSPSRSDMVLSYKRRGKKRSRRKAKSMKRLTRLQIYKAIGVRQDQQRAFYSLLQGAFNQSADATSQPALSTNNTYMFHIATLNDFYHYHQVAANQVGLVPTQLDPTNNSISQDNPYFTSSHSDVTMTNLSNVNLHITPVRITLQNDLVNSDIGTYANYPDHLTAYCLMSQMVAEAADCMSVGNFFYLNAPLAPGNMPLVSPETRTFRAPSFQWPTGFPFPWKQMQKIYNIKFGQEQLLRVQSSIQVRCKGRKGEIPLPQMASQTVPSSAVSSNVNVARAPTGFRGKTVCYFYIVRQASHIVSATGNANEAYLGGPFKIAVDVQRKTRAVGIPTNQYNSNHANFWQDLRPWADLTASNAARAMVDTSETGSAVSSII